MRYDDESHRIELSQGYYHNKIYIKYIKIYIPCLHTKNKNEVYSFRKQVPLAHSLRPKATAHFVIYESCRTVKSSLCMKKFSLTDVKNTSNKNTYNSSTCNSSTCNSSKCNNNTCENNTCNSNKCNNNTSNITIKRKLVTPINNNTCNNSTCNGTNMTHEVVGSISKLSLSSRALSSSVTDRKLLVLVNLDRTFL